ncbi:EAL domain-containing protein [Rhizobium laguerreae]|uniref:sensor domain-containing protein n=1 Tax=Rhizobium laguerreae TaxID=1076926 RepID=UPI001C91C972|nr:EAL domain-containing protein [Rhizobium laguerreae]MBY3155334.1 EAL domain-containing protein [Rhizobium laguerreae]
MYFNMVSIIRKRFGNAEAEAAEDAMFFRKPSLQPLFQGRSALFQGLIGQIGACMIAYADSNDNVYFVFCGIAVMVYLGRVVQFRAYDRVSAHLISEASTEAEIDQWYRYYMTASSMTSLLVGCLTGYSIYFHPGQWACSIPLALTLGTMVAAVGRNYANGHNVFMITMCSFLPCITAFLGFAAYSGKYFIGIGGAALLIPFMLATQAMAKAVRKTLKDTITAMEDADGLRQKFYNAVSNMPNGLLMLEPSGVIKFSNGVAKAMFGVPDNVELTGKSIEDLFMYGARKGSNEAEMLGLPPHGGNVYELGNSRVRLSPADAVGFKERIFKLLDGTSKTETLKFSDAFQIEFTIRQETSDATSLHHNRHDGYVVVCEDVTERVRQQEKVRYSANIDGLSDIPNRSHMRELVEEAKNIRAKSRGPNIALCVFDVDKFKDINDTLGHAAGDEVIRSVAASMKQLKRLTPNLIISRLGGDEFVFVLPHIAENFDVGSFMDNAFRTICKHYDISDKSVEVRCSGGVIVVPKAKFNLDDAMNKADLALYKVKQEKRDRKESTLRWTLFDHELEQVYRNTQQMRAELQEAVANGQMVVEYQPMCTPDGLKIEMCEALCRWHHPQLGVLGPDNFIGIAESMNLIGDITKHMIRTACRDCATWDDETCVSVNLSVLDLAHFEIVEVISEALRAAKLPATRLQVEITESIFLKESEKARQILTTLKNMGVKTAIDDFGTGYSNLAIISALPLDKVKVDRAFLQGITTEEKPRRLFDAIVSLGKNMGLGIVVEGVETTEQLEQINKTGVNLIQGYLFGKPMKSHEILDALIAKKASAGGNVISIVSRNAH